MGSGKGKPLKAALDFSQLWKIRFGCSFFNSYLHISLFDFAIFGSFGSRILNI